MQCDNIFSYIVARNEFRSTLRTTERLVAASEPRMSYIANRAIHEQEWGATNFTRVLRLLLLFVSRKEGEKGLLIERITPGLPRTKKQEYSNLHQWV